MGLLLPKVRCNLMPAPEYLTAGEKKKTEKAPSAVQYARCANKCHQLESLYKKEQKGFCQTLPEVTNATSVSPAL